VTSRLVTARRALFDLIDQCGPEEAERLLATIADARCIPPGYLAEVAAILRAGAERHGCAPHETGGEQSLDDHLRHLLGHANRVDGDLMHGRDVKPDPDSGRSQFAHVGARAALGWEREQAARGEKP
jgi:hypothetical protein